jgi:hypothetical protein
MMTLSPQQQTLENQLVQDIARALRTALTGVYSEEVIARVVDRGLSLVPKADMANRNTVVGDIVSVSTPRLEEVLNLKDLLMISDYDFQTILVSEKHGIVSLPQFARLHHVVKMRDILDRRLVLDFGIQYRNHTEDEPSWVDLTKTVRMLFYNAYIMGRIPATLQHGYVLKIKVTMDGSFVGSNNNFLAAGMVLLPDSSGFRVQSALEVFPIGLGWSGESTEKLELLIPELKEHIQNLNADGIPIDDSFGIARLLLDIHAAADLSTIWKILHIGGPSAAHTCPFCMTTKEERQRVGLAKFDIRQDANRREHTHDFFGLTGFKLHFCTLHAHMRISERLMKLLATESAKLEKRFKADLLSLEVIKKKAQQKLRQLNNRSKNKQQFSSAAAKAAAVEQTKYVESNAKAEMEALKSTKSRVYGLGPEGLSDKIVELGVLENTYNCQAVDHKGGKDDQSMQTSSFTGQQGTKLLGLLGAQVKVAETPPYQAVVVASVGYCEHMNADGAMQTAPDSSCFHCRIMGVFKGYREVVFPVLRATSMESLDAPAREAGNPHGFDLDKFRFAAQHWGRSIGAAFKETKNPISDYCTYYLLHRGYYSVLTLLKFYLL